MKVNESVLCGSNYGILPNPQRVPQNVRLVKYYHVNEVDLILASHLINVDLALVVATVDNEFFISTSPGIGATADDIFDKMRELSDL